VPLDYKQDTSGPDRGTTEEKPVLPDPTDDNEVYRLIAPPALMKMAAPHYTAFWWDIERLEHAHRNTCLAAFKATLDVSASVELPGEIDGLEGLLSSVRALLARWKLADEAGQGPLVDPFTAALIQGVRQRARRPNSFGPLLEPVRHVGSGDVLTALALGHQLRAGVPLARVVSDLDLSVPTFGSGRNTKQVQLIDAEVWTLRRIGEVPSKLLAKWRGASRQQIERAITGMDRVLENGLPHLRPNASKYS